MQKFRIASLNVNGVKANIENVKNMCNNFDIILLQETLLSHDNLNVLGIIDNNFSYAAIPARLPNDLCGRPSGGLAVMWRKNISSHISVLSAYDFCIGLKMFSGNKTINI